MGNTNFDFDFSFENTENNKKIFDFYKTLF